MMIKHQDAQLHAMGQYVLSAVFVAIEKCFAGKKSKAKYIEKPLSQYNKKETGNLSEKEKELQRKLFMAKLQAMQADYEIKH